MRQRLSFILDTDADPSDMLDRVIEFGHELAEELGNDIGEVIEFDAGLACVEPVSAEATK